MDMDKIMIDDGNGSFFPVYVNHTDSYLLLPNNVFKNQRIDVTFDTKDFVQTYKDLDSEFVEIC